MKKLILALVCVLCLISIGSAGWLDPPAPSMPKSQSRLTMQMVGLKPVKDGMSVEQLNIRDRMILDNRLDVPKYVYIIGQNGQICLNFIVRGKLTSSGKRLTPRTVATYGGEFQQEGMKVTIGGKTYETSEVIEDDGTYGDSMPYYFMFTTAGNFVKVIPTGMFLTVEADKQLTPTELVFSNTNVKN